MNHAKDEKLRPGPQAKRKARVLLIDDHPIVRNGLEQLINQEEDLVVSGGAGSAAEALVAIEKSPPDLAIVDISLKSTNGIELTKTIRAGYPHVPVLMLSMHDEVLYAERALLQAREDTS